MIPAYLGTDSKIRAWDPTDVAAAGPLLAELLAMLPQLCCVILGGRAAKATWTAHAPAGIGVEAVECPHPSPLNVNPRPAARPLIVDAWRRAAAAAAAAATT